MIVAGQILRACILLRNRTGHNLAFGSETVRRNVVSAARYGAITSYPVECQFCGWQAPLNKWVRSAILTAEGRKEVLGVEYRPKWPQDTAYLRDCPGEEYAADLLEVTSAPGERC